MENKKNLGIAVVAVVGLALLIFMFWGASEVESPLINGTTIDTSDWLTYENTDFNFKIMHPADWAIYEAPNNQIAPAFNIYPKSYGTPENLPLIHHSQTPNVSIFPNGVPTEGVFGDTVSSNITFKEPPFRADDFVLENNERWATFAGYPYGPKSWNGFGFLWARADINNYSAVCLRDGKEMPVESCDFLGSNDKIIHRGSVDKNMRAIEVEILKTFQFTVQTTGGMINISSPEAGETITSPLTVRGEARGGWYFEATFPIILTDWDGKIIAQWYATADGEWMTPDYVPFEGTLEFENPSFEQDFSKNGYLIFRNSNASGLPEHDRAVEIPIRFE